MVDINVLWRVGAKEHMPRLSFKKGNKLMI